MRSGVKIMEKYVAIIENKPFTAYPSDSLGYSTPTEHITISLPILRTFKHLKIIEKRYKPRYRFFGRYTLLASNDKKEWVTILDQLITR